MLSGNKKKIMMIGGTAAFISGSVYLLFKKLKKGNVKSYEQKLDKETMLKIMKEYNKGYYTIYLTIQMMSTQIKSQVQGKINTQELNQILMNNPQITNDISLLEEEVTKMFNITSEQVRFNLENTFKNDKEIQAIQQNIKQQMDNAIQGMEPNAVSDIPEFMTPQKTMEILYQQMEENSVEIHRYCKEVIQKGQQVNTQNPLFMQGLHESLIKSKRESSILAKSGLDSTHDHPEKIFNNTKNKYLRANTANFASKTREMENKHSQMIQKILQNAQQIDVEEIRKQYQVIEENEIINKKSNPNKKIEEKIEEKNEEIIEEKIEEKKEEKIEEKKEEKIEEIEKKEEEIEEKKEEIEEKKEEKIEEIEKKEEEIEEKKEEIEEKKEEIEEKKEEKIEEKIEEKKEEKIEEKIEEIEDKKEEIEEKKEEKNEEKKEEIEEQEVKIEQTLEQMDETDIIKENNLIRQEIKEIIN